jgi:hypothetical protein
MRYNFLFVIIFSITISSCQLKRKTINISPNLGNPLTLSKEITYCVETYNNSRKELLLKILLENKLKLQGININVDCKEKLVIEVYNIIGDNSKNVPVEFTYKKETNTRKGNEANYTLRTKEWNDYKTVSYKEIITGIIIYIDVYDKDNVLIDSVNSYSDISNRKLKIIEESSDVTASYKFQKIPDNNYPIYSSVNEINVNHILELDDKILKSNIDSSIIENIKINMSIKAKQNYKKNNENFWKKEFYSRRCMQRLGENSEIMSVQQLYYFMSTNSFDKFSSINGISSEVPYYLWNNEKDIINSVYFHTPACSEVDKYVKNSKRITKKTACKWSPSSYSKYSSGYSGLMPTQIYSQYFEPHKTYVYYWDHSNVGGNIFCASKELKSPKLGETINLDDVQVTKSFSYIKLNVK